MLECRNRMPSTKLIVLRDIVSSANQLTVVSSCENCALLVRVLFDCTLQAELLEKERKHFQKKGLEAFEGRSIVQIAFPSTQRKRCSLAEYPPW